MARYIELFVRADAGKLKAYLTGYAAAPPGFRVVFADDAGFHVARLKERIRHHGDVEHVIVEASHAARVGQALDAAAPNYHFEIKGERNLEQVHFAFEFDTPSREVAEKLKALLAHLPAGAVLEQYTPREEQDPRAAGTEVYTSEHDYRFKGRGVIGGEAFAVVDARAKLVDVEFTRCNEIEASHAA
jgi:hypothetical protein